METTSTTNEKAASRSDINLPNLIRKIFEIAQNAGCPELVQPLVDHANRLQDKIIHISFIGMTEARLLNELINVEAFTQSILSPVVRLDIFAAAAGEAPYYLSGDVKVPLLPNTLASFQDQDEKKALQLFIDNQWLREQNVVIHTREFPQETEENGDELFDFLAMTDITVFLTDALAPLTKNEFFFIKNSAGKNIPGIAGLSRLRMVGNEERPGVITYLSNNIKKQLGSKALLENNPDTGEVSLKNLMILIDEKIASFDLFERRLNFFRLRARNSLTIMKKLLMQYQEENRIKTSEIKQAAIDKKRVLDDLGDQWTQIENVLVEKRLAIENKLRDHLAKNREQVFKNLLFEVNRSSDAKSSWERDLPFFINKELQVTAERLSSIISNQITETLRWIKDEVYRVFRYSISLKFDSNVQLTEASYEPAELPLLNQQKWRINARYGAALTVVGVGFFLVSVPIGGIVVASSIIYQAAVDQYIYSTGRKDKDLISDKLQKVVGITEAAYLNEFSTKLKNAFDQIIALLKDNRAAWLNEQTQLAEGSTALELENNTEKELEKDLLQLDQILAELS